MYANILPPLCRNVSLFTLALLCLTWSAAITGISRAADPADITRAEWAAYLNDAGFKDADQRLNATYRKIMSGLAPQEKQILLRDQRAWIKTRNKDAHARHVKGSLEYIRALADATARREAELRTNHPAVFIPPVQTAVFPELPAPPLAQRPAQPSALTPAQPSASPGKTVIQTRPQATLPEADAIPAGDSLVPQAPAAGSPQTINARAEGKPAPEQTDGAPATTPAPDGTTATASPAPDGATATASPAQGRVAVTPVTDKPATRPAQDRAVIPPAPETSTPQSVPAKTAPLAARAVDSRSFALAPKPDEPAAAQDRKPEKEPAAPVSPGTPPLAVGRALPINITPAQFAASYNLLAYSFNAATFPPVPAGVTGGHKTRTEQYPVTGEITIHFKYTNGQFDKPEIITFLGHRFMTGSGQHRGEIAHALLALMKTLHQDSRGNERTRDAKITGFVDSLAGAFTADASRVWKYDGLVYVITYMKKDDLFAMTVNADSGRSRAVTRDR